MALLEMGGRKFTIPAGDVFLGSDPGSAIHLTIAGVLPRHAKLKGLPAPPQSVTPVPNSPN